MYANNEDSDYGFIKLQTKCKCKLFEDPVTSVVLRSMAVVLLLLIHFSVAPIILWSINVYGPCFVVLYLMLFLILQSIYCG